MYMAAGKLAEYDLLTVPLFVSGYLVVMLTEKAYVWHIIMQHLHGLMANAELYGWEPIRAIYWLQQLDQGRVTWVD